ncbi:MAG: hypothetical protein R6W93_07050 [Candidatus Limnocylindrales bacterium]
MAVIVMVMLLAGSVGSVIAQDEAAYLSGATTVTEIVEPPEVTTTPDGVTQVRGVVGEQTLTMDDPRLSGAERFVHNEDYYGDVVGPVWGTSLIENDGGAWVGSYRGLMLADGSATYFGTYVGEDGYEGLSAACVSTSDGTSGFTGECVIYPGAVPEFQTAE